MVSLGTIQGHAWQGACVVGDICGRGHAWQGVACVVGDMATAADGTHTTGMHSCSLSVVGLPAC